MSKWWAEAVLTEAWFYILRRKYRTVNVISFVFLPVVALLVIVLGPFVAAIHGMAIGAFEGVKEFLEDDLPRNAIHSLRPRWTKKDAELEALIAQAQQTLEDGHD